MFKELGIKHSYNTSEDNIAKDFYNKILSYSKNYYRASAYFSAKILSNLSEGIHEVLKKGGKIKYIFSHQLNPYDYEIMKEGYTARERVLSKIGQIFEEEVNELDCFDSAKISNLAFLIQEGVVDIKIAFIKEGIFHDKFGLFEDENGNSIYFIGSFNETVAAIKKNFESFDVTCSWDGGIYTDLKIDKAKAKFEQLWNNEVDNLIVLDMPEVIKNSIIKRINTHEGTPKIILESDIEENLIEFDYDGNRKRIIARIGLKVLMNLSNPIYKLKIKRYLENIEGKDLIFKRSIYYKNYSRLVESFEEYAENEKEKGNLVFIKVSENLLKHVETIQYDIDKRAKLGTVIKEKNVNEDIDIKNSFEEFKEILEETMVRRLKPDQLWNAFHVVKMVKSANFSVPGSGKTTIAYAAYAYLLKKGLVDKIVMVGPMSSFKSWKDEFFSNFGEKLDLNYTSLNEIRNQDLISRAASSNLILINYESLPSVEKALGTVINKKTFLIFDEVHKVKAIDGVWAKVAAKISENPIYKLVLTGTPIPNSYLDIYNMLNYLYTHEYNDYFGFDTKYLLDASYEQSKLNNINKKLYPFFCRITKKDLEVPEAEPDNIIRCKPTFEEELIYQKVYELTKGFPLLYYIRMMQAMSNPKQLLKSLTKDDFMDIFKVETDEADESYGFNINKADFSYDNTFVKSNELRELVNKVDRSSKFKEAVNLIEKLVSENKPVLVWCIFIDTIAKLREDLREKRINTESITGGVSLDDRESIINRFSNNEVQVLIANPQTLAESVSLHHSCHDAIYLEYSFNYTHMAQSRDRIHRLGLPDGQYTRYYYMLADDNNHPVDQKIYDRLLEKHKIMIKSIESKSLEIEKFSLQDDIKLLLND